MSDNLGSRPDPDPDGGPVPDQRPRLRASDAEREAALRILGKHFADGRLEQAEFDERTDAALAARTQDELRALFVDLPGPMPVPSPASGQAGAADRASAAFAAGRWRARPVAVHWTPPLVLVPVFFAFAILAALHGAPPFPLIPLAFILLRRHRWNRWNREARPWI